MPCACALEHDWCEALGPVLYSESLQCKLSREREHSEWGDRTGIGSSLAGVRLVGTSKGSSLITRARDESPRAKGWVRLSSADENPAYGQHSPSWLWVIQKHPFYTMSPSPYNECKSIPSTVSMCIPWVTIVSTHCYCPANVHLIYTMENDFLPLNNVLIQHKSKMFMKIFLKVSSEQLGPGASF